MKQYLRGDLIFSKLPVIGQEQLTLANFWNFTSKNLNIFISLSESITEVGNVDENLRHNHSNEIFSAVFSNGTINIKIPKVWPLKSNLLYIEALFNTFVSHDQIWPHKTNLFSSICFGLLPQNSTKASVSPAVTIIIEKE